MLKNSKKTSVSIVNNNTESENWDFTRKHESLQFTIKSWKHETNSKNNRFV